jgi:signal transduction histidine kinase
VLALHDVTQRRLAEELARAGLLSRLATIQEDERRRIARELHDETGQQLTALTLGLKALRGRPEAAPLAAALDALATRSPVPATVACQVPERLPQPVELAAYFVASEALANVAKYAHATAVEVRVATNASTLTIEVADDGIGGASPTDGSGLRGLADRVEALGGRLAVSSAPGAGTIVAAELPLPG